jgi:hypothetical protein
MYQRGRRIDRESKAICGSFQVIRVVASSIPGVQFSHRLQIY